MHAGPVGLRALAALIGLLAINAACADPAAAPCAAAEHHQFDFWIGRWRVTEAGRLAGHNVIAADLEHCALFESWTSATGSRGRSVNFYDRDRHRWHQTWIDAHGDPLALEGGLRDGSLVLEGERPDPATGRMLRHRITWTPRPDGTVRQWWQVLKPPASSWTTVFDGLYAREP